MTITVLRGAHLTHPIEDNLWNCDRCGLTAEAHDPVLWHDPCKPRLRVVVPDEQGYGWVRPEDENLTEFPGGQDRDGAEGSSPVPGVGEGPGTCDHVETPRVTLCASCMREVRA